PSRRIRWQGCFRVLITPRLQRAGEVRMATRREFVTAAAGLGFAGGPPLEGPAQGQGRPPGGPGSGKRVKTIDVHAHCAFPEAMALMGRKVQPASLVMAEDRIRAMDEQGIDMEALSINPYWYAAPRDVAAELIRVQNEKLAELCAA